MEPKTPYTTTCCTVCDTGYSIPPYVAHSVYVRGGGGQVYHPLRLARPRGRSEEVSRGLGGDGV